ncbi:MAG: PorT family protein [Flavobacteriales bacterium]|nr:PorT family protein [Flavobacteriales bacterium]
MTLNKILVPFFLLLSTIVLSQKKHPIKLGVNAGTNYNSIRGSNLTKDTKDSFGYCIGGSFEIQINSNLSFLTNINYERKSIVKNYRGFIYPNYVFDPTIPPTDVKEVTKFDYLSIPLLAKLYFDGYHESFINAGVSINVPIEVRNYFNDMQNNLDFNQLYGENYFGLQLGIGHDFELSEKTLLTLELRDNCGISEIESKSFYGESTKMNSINLIATWTISL